MFLGPLCSDSIPGFLGIFDLSIAPSLLYYSYLPIIVGSLLISLYVFVKDKKSLQSQLLLAMTLFFVLWVGNILVQWVGAYDSIVMFAWQMTALFEAGLYLSALYFAYVFLFRKDLSLTGKLALALPFLAILLVLPTTFNVSFYDLTNCEGAVGLLWKAIYSIEPAVIVGVVLFGFEAFRREKEHSVRVQNLIATTGLTLFLAIFWLSNIYGEVSKVYEFNLWGPLGMLIFLILLEYIIIQYKSFNVKSLGAQVLVASLLILIGSEFFFVQNIVNQFLVALTLIVTAIFGFILIRSVRLEVQQREEIEQLATSLEQTNERQEGLIHFISHEVKGFLTKDMSAFAALVEGDFGVLPDSMRAFVESALFNSREGARSVIDLLQASNQKKGTVEYKKEPFDFATVVKEWFDKIKPIAEKKGLKYEFILDETKVPYSAIGDRGQMGDHVIRNLIENATNYTLQGGITVSLTKSDGKMIFSVKDTGVGITEEDKKRLFTEGGRGKESIKVNVHSTGYGLFIAKNIVDAHGGTIRAESAGAGKGSEFIIELPAA